MIPKGIRIWNNEFQPLLDIGAQLLPKNKESRRNALRRRLHGNDDSKFMNWANEEWSGGLATPTRED